MNSIERLESEVRGYCRDFPAMFDRAQGAWLYDEQGNAWLDFFAGAGALNYGHNPAPLKQALLDYLARDGVAHSLDMFSVAKREFLERFQRVILAPRGLEYKVQFTGPTGTNAVEAALKLARKVTGREHILSFTNSFHGMTLGSLAVTGNGFKRRGAGVSLHDVTPMPFDGYLGRDVNTLDYLEAVLDDEGSGVDKPAAVILETVQAEGGVNVAGFEWLKRLAALLKRHGVLLIVDDIQVGCGRTGPFFSFEPAGLKPDIVCLSKSLSGYGVPLAVVLMKPEHDVWAPGEHNGTFRGHNPAFVTAAAALQFWENDALARDTARKAGHVASRLKDLLNHTGMAAAWRGRGLIQGLAFEDAALAGRIAAACVERKLIIETAGVQNDVLKLLPSLTIRDAELDQGLDIIQTCVRDVLDRKARAAA
ncbi:MAG TPA: diaminobutyrate--2-oxoglutarate transaminase [Gammaproteobacteria bacterium]|nr:diaminobutyrate--2-oxoglutarate transaminase [Gammaproteobacteria bacterium]